jgi:hypothetical protein
VNSFNYTRELGGLFVVWATAQPDQDLVEVETVLKEEIAEFLAHGPNPEELERSKSSQRASFIRGLERIGGFGGKSDVLAASEVYLGSPDAHKAAQGRFRNATTQNVHEAGKRWLAEGAFTLVVHPFPEYDVAESDVERSGGPPEVTEFPTGTFPDRETATLSNGLKVILAERSAVPVVNFNLLLDAGYASDLRPAPPWKSPTSSSTWAQRSPPTPTWTCPASPCRPSKRTWMLRSISTPTWRCTPRSRRRSSNGCTSRHSPPSSGKRCSRSAWRCGSSLGFSMATVTPTARR